MVVNSTTGPPLYNLPTSIIDICSAFDGNSAILIRSRAQLDEMLSDEDKFILYDAL